MSQSKVEKVLEKVQTLPPLPAAVEKLVRMVDEPDTTVQMITKVISMDPALTARLLRVANSAFYGFAGKISSISKAVMVLGGQQIRNLALGIAIFGVRNKASAQRPLQYELFWRHSLAVAVAARLLARRFGTGDPEESFVGGLLHDIGKTVYFEFFAEDYEKVLEDKYRNRQPLCLLEKEEFGLNHAEVGKYLCEYWKIPQGLSTMVAMHHFPRSELGDHASGVSLIKLSNALAHISEIGFAGETLVDLELADLTRIGAKGMSHCRNVIQALPREVEQAEAMFELPGSGAGIQPVADPDAPAVPVLLEEDYARKLVDLAVTAMGRTVTDSEDEAANEACQAIIADASISPELRSVIEQYKIPILDFTGWQKDNVAGNGAVPVDRLRRWLESELDRE